jgi:spore coat protein CotH
MKYFLFILIAFVLVSCNTGNEDMPITEGTTYLAPDDDYKNPFKNDKVTVISIKGDYVKFTYESDDETVSETKTAFRYNFYELSDKDYIEKEEIRDFNLWLMIWGGIITCICLIFGIIS